jgi:hypothetical protein
MEENGGKVKNCKQMFSSPNKELTLFFSLKKRRNSILEQIENPVEVLLT